MNMRVSAALLLIAASSAIGRPVPDSHDWGTGEVLAGGTALLAAGAAAGYIAGRGKVPPSAAIEGNVVPSQIGHQIDQIVPPRPRDFVPPHNGEHSSAPSTRPFSEKDSTPTITHNGSQSPELIKLAEYRQTAQKNYHWYEVEQHRLQDSVTRQELMIKSQKTAFEQRNPRPQAFDEKVLWSDKLAETLRSKEDQLSALQADLRNNKRGLETAKEYLDGLEAQMQSANKAVH